MDIRPALSGELDAVCALHAAAFAASAYGHNGEAALVRALHDEGDALVSLGCWQDGFLAGHVLFSRMTVAADGLPIPAAALAPIAVAPDRRRQGIGAALIGAGHRALASQDISMAFVLGENAYYERFGYDASLAEPFASPYAGPHFMACALDGTISRPQTGVAIHASAFG